MNVGVLVAEALHRRHKLLLPLDRRTNITNSMASVFNA
jgi:hypothetical protein